jgi:arylformamidase
MLSARGAYLQLSEAEIDIFSPIRHLAELDCPVVVAYGGAETDEYRRHATSFHAALQDGGKRSELLFAAGQNHFEISCTLGDRNGLLFRAAADLASRSK